MHTSAIITSRVPIRKKEFSRAMSNYDETYDEIIETYDEIVVKTASKCLARMTGCWDPEFEPSVEEIVDYPMISLWRFSQFAAKFL